MKRQEVRVCRFPDDRCCSACRWWRSPSWMPHRGTGLCALPGALGPGGSLRVTGAAATCGMWRRIPGRGRR